MRVDIIDMAVKVKSCSWRQVEKHFLSFGYIKKPRKIDVDVATFSPMIRKPIWRWNCETLRDLTGWKWQKAEGWNWLVEEFERQAGLVAAGVRGKIFIKFGSWWYKVDYDQIDPESFSLPCGSFSWWILQSIITWPRPGDQSDTDCELQEAHEPWIWLNPILAIWREADAWKESQNPKSS